MSAGLEIINLTKRFERGTPNEKTALDGLCLTVPAGEFVTVLGSNGAGKSTTLKMICGMLRGVSEKCLAAYRQLPVPVK